MAETTEGCVFPACRVGWDIETERRVFMLLMLASPRPGRQECPASFLVLEAGLAAKEVLAFLP